MADDTRLDQSARIAQRTARTVNPPCSAVTAIVPIVRAISKGRVRSQLNGGVAAFLAMFLRTDGLKASIGLFPISGRHHRVRPVAVWNRRCERRRGTASGAPSGFESQPVHVKM